jgi:4-hydroxy-3-polyprenylbenzoate decarboxylase
MKTVAVAFTGASGLPYGMRLVECLINAGCQVQLLYSQAAQVVAKQEMDFTLPGRPAEAEIELSTAFSAEPGQLKVYGLQEWFAPFASGSNPPDAYVICPCTMGTLAKVAAGMADDLITRAADVVLKEGRKLIIVPRETPFSVIHLENMLRLAKAGAVILPPNPGFYHHPENIGGMIDFVVARIMDQLGIPQTLIARWGENT